MLINGKEYNESHLIIQGDTVKIQFVSKSLMDDIVSLYKFTLEHRGKRRHVYVHDVNDNEIILKQW